MHELFWNLVIFLSLIVTLFKPGVWDLELAVWVYIVTELLPVSLASFFQL